VCAFWRATAIGIGAVLMSACRAPAEPPGGDNEEERLWYEARLRDRAYAYRAYLHAFESGPHAKEARFLYDLHSELEARLGSHVRADLIPQYLHVVPAVLRSDAGNGIDELLTFELLRDAAFAEESAWRAGVTVQCAGIPVPSPWSVARNDTVDLYFSVGVIEHNAVAVGYAPSGALPPRGAMLGTEEEQTSIEDLLPEVERLRIRDLWEGAAQPESDFEAHFLQKVRAAQAGDFGGVCDGKCHPRESVWLAYWWTEIRE
jgi:hypothetical protein